MSHSNPSNPSRADTERFRALVQQFVRRFGLLVTNETPCGHPISVSHAHALMILLEDGRPRRAISQTDLGRALGIDKSNVARLCARMEEDGHVAQRRSPDDGRSRLLALKRKGATLARELRRSSRKRFGEVLARVSPAHRAGLCVSLARLDAALASLPGTEEEA